MNKLDQDPNGMNSSAMGAARPNKTGPVTDPVWSGDKGMDQSVQLFQNLPPQPSQSDNYLPPLPPFQRGVK